MRVSRRLRSSGRGLLVGLPLLAAPLVGLVQAAPSPADRGAAAPVLRARPAHVPQGTTVVLRGSGFAAHAHVTLVAARPRHRARRLGSAVAGRDGSFVAPVAISAHAALGRYAVRACADRCRQEARTRFRVVRR